MAPKKTWSDLTSVQQRIIIGAGAVEAAVTSVAVIDLARRPRSLVRGPKALWLALFAVQPVGPIAYLVRGRRPA
jgi:hypothetical protein